MESANTAEDKNETQNLRTTGSEYGERFAFATEAAQIGYWFCDLPFDKLVWDKRVKEHFWLPEDQEVDIKLFYDRLHVEDRERTRQAIDLSISTHTQYDVEYRTVSPLGQIKWIRAVGRTAYDSSGVPIRFDGVTRDVSALKEAEETRDKAKEALVRSEKLAMVGRLAATIAHEINNPLAAVGDLLFLIKESTTGEDNAKYVELAIAEVNRISQIVSDTLRFNRRSVQPSWTRTSHLIDSALAIYEARLRTGRVTIERGYIESDDLFCFPSELRQVFANLISNAIDAMKEAGTLKIRTRMQRHPITRVSGLSISFADSGQGMNSTTMADLFQPFVSTKGDSGTGLGLWVSREILKKHNASIRVRSNQTTGKKGTIFRIWIPVISGTQSQDGASSMD